MSRPGWFGSAFVMRFWWKKVCFGAIRKILAGKMIFFRLNKTVRCRTQIRNTIRAILKKEGLKIAPRQKSKRNIEYRTRNVELRNLPTSKQV